MRVRHFSAQLTVGVVSLLASVVAFATCWDAGHNFSGATIADVANAHAVAAKAGADAYWATQSPTATCNYTATAITSSGYTIHESCSGASTAVNDYVVAASCEGACDPSLNSADRSTVVATTVGSYCNPVSSCKTVVSRGVSFDGVGVFIVHDTSEACSASASSLASGDTSQGETCATGSSGLQVCRGPNGGNNCGYVNGDYMCLSASNPPNDRCFGAGGGLVCSQATPTPPSPDNGTPGVRPTPASVVHVTNTTNNTTVSANYNYYTSAQVAASSRPPSDGQPSGGAGNGNTSARESTASQASGGEQCDVAPTCDGDGIQCAVLHQDWLIRCGASVPTLTDMGLPEAGAPGSTLTTTTVDLTTSIPTDSFLAGPSCPSDLSFSTGIWGTVVIPLSSFCGLFSILGAFMIAGAWVGAIKIVIGVPAVQGA